MKITGHAVGQSLPFESVGAAMDWCRAQLDAEPSARAAVVTLSDPTPGTAQQRWVTDQDRIWHRLGQDGLRGPMARIDNEKGTPDD